MSSAERVPTFASLSIRNYRLFWTGGLISNVGTWVARVAQDWLVLTVLTDNSAWALGVVTGLQFLPIALLSPYAGALADRMSKRHLLMYTQTAQGLVGLTLAGLVLGGWIQLWHVYLLAALLGIAAAFDGPARQAFAPEMVSEKLIPNSVGLNTTSFHAARLVGPAVAGLIIGWWGVGPALVVNGLSFLAVLAALARMDPERLTPAPLVRSKGAVMDGVRYVRSRPDIILAMFIVFMLGTFGMNFQITNALMATAVFGVGPVQYGLLGSVLAIGSLAAGLMAARRVELPWKLIIGSLGAFALAEIGLSVMPGYWSYAALLVPAGLAALTVMTAANASVQLSTEPAMRGRVMALYQAIFLGGTPLGAPFIGWVGDAWGPRWTLAIGGIACALTFVVAVAVLSRRQADRAAIVAPLPS